MRFHSRYILHSLTRLSNHRYFQPHLLYNLRGHTILEVEAHNCRSWNYTDGLYSNWIFGKPLFKKYQMVFDQDRKTYGFYLQASNKESGRRKCR